MSTFPSHNGSISDVNRLVSAISELRKRHLFQIAVVYIGVAWFFLEVTDFVVANYDLSRQLIDVAVLLAVLGFPAVLVIGWFHGERGHQDVHRSEAWILATLGVLAAIGTYRIATGEEPGAADPQRAEVEAAAPAAGGPDAVMPAGGASADLGRRSVAVFPFESHVTDPELDWLGPGLADLLTTNLAQAPDLRVVARQRLFDLLREAGREEGEEIPQSIATKIAAQSGARHMVWGSVVGSAEDLAIDAQLVELETGTVLAAERVRGDDVFALVDTLSVRLSHRLAGRPPQAAVAHTAAAELGTRDLGAFGAFARGLRLERLGESDEAARLFERAAERDPSFVLARVLAVASRAAAAGAEAEAEAQRRLALETLEGMDVRIIGLEGAHPESLAVRVDSVLAKLSSKRFLHPPGVPHAPPARPRDQGGAREDGTGSREPPDGRDGGAAPGRP